MPTAKEVRDLALSKMPALIDMLVKDSEAGDIQSRRLLSELAGMTKAGAGRPARKKFQEEDSEPTPQEVQRRTKEAEDILSEYGSS